MSANAELSSDCQKLQGDLLCLQHEKLALENQIKAIVNAREGSE